MNQTLQLTDYIPRYVSLYYVDYRDNLDEHEDIQEECIRSNNMEKLYEKAYEWYEEQESSNMHAYSGGYPFSISGDIRSVPS